MTRPASHQAGFTLAETLVALFILALVTAAGGGLLIGATGSGKQVRERDETVRKLDMAQAMIRNDIAALAALETCSGIVHRAAIRSCPLCVLAGLIRAVWRRAVTCRQCAIVCKPGN